MTDNHYDGVFDHANRTNQATGRSWHIPPRRSHALHFLIPLGGFLVVVGLAFWAASKVGS